MKAGVSRGLKILFYVLVLVSAAVYAARNASGLRDALSTVSMFRIASALILVLAGYILRFSVWRMLSTGFGFGSAPGYDARTWFFSYLGRYLPGNAGLAAVRLTAYPGVERGRIAGATMIEYGLTLGAAACFVLSGLAWLSADLPGWVPYVVAGFASLILFMTSPWMFRRVSDSVLGVLRRPLLEMVPGIRRQLAAGGVSLLASALHGISFFLLLSISPAGSGIQDLLASSSGYFLGGLAGALFILSPAGVGVREALVVMALGGSLGFERVAVAAALMRMITVASELLLAAVAVVWRKVESGR